MMRAGFPAVVSMTRRLGSAAETEAMLDKLNCRAIKRAIPFFANWSMFLFYFHIIIADLEEIWKGTHPCPVHRGFPLSFREGKI